MAERGAHAAGPVVRETHKGGSSQAPERKSSATDLFRLVSELADSPVGTL